MPENTPTPWRRSKDHWLRVLDSEGKKVCEISIAFRSSDEAAALAAERAECAKAICPGCREGAPITSGDTHRIQQGDSAIYERCQATAIRNRGN